MSGILLYDGEYAGSYNAMRLAEIAVDLLQREGNLLFEAFKLLRQCEVARLGHGWS